MPLTPAERFAAMSPEEQAAAMAQPATPAPLPEPDPDPGPEDFDLESVWDDTLALTFRGKTYTLHAPDIETGLLCQRIVGVGLGAVSGRNTAAKESRIAAQINSGILDDDAEEELYVLLLGGDKTHPGYREDWDVYAQLTADRAPFKALEHFGVTALWWTGVSREFALDYWRTGGRPKAQPTPAAPAPRQPQDRRPATSGRKTTKTASSTAPSRRKRPAAATEGTPGRKS